MIYKNILLKATYNNIVVIKGHIFDIVPIEFNTKIAESYGECDICMEEDNIEYYICNMCFNHFCIGCWHKMTKCPFCRVEYNFGHFLIKDCIYRYIGKTRNHLRNQIVIDIIFLLLVITLSFFI